MLLSQYPLNPWNVQVSLLTSLRAVVKAGSGDGASGGEEKKGGEGERKQGWGEADVGKIAEVFFLGMDNAKYSVVRNAALEAFGDLVNATKGIYCFLLCLFLLFASSPLFFSLFFYLSLLLV
jgi:hypothetical protein